MKYHDIQLAEASVANIKVIQQLTNAIWSSLPEIPEGTVKDVYLSQLSGFNRIYKMYEKDPKFGKPFQVMETTRLRIVNDDNYQDPYYKKGDAWGYHSSNDNLMLVWYNSITDAYGTGYTAERAARSVLAHEIRHLFQYSLYPKYFNSRQAFKKPYESQQIEIDAVWSQILTVDIDVEDYRGYPKEYVEEVMAALTDRKKLSDKEIQHYSRKTLKYYRQFFDENTEAEWRRIVNIWGKEIAQHSNYSVENFVGDVMQDLDDYLEYKINNPQIKQQVLDYYAGETRKEYKKLSAGPRKERKKSAIIGQLIPVWEKVVEKYHEQWFDHNVSTVKLTIQILGDMRDKLDQAAGNDYELRGQLSGWFGNMTRERIIAARSWMKQPPVPGNN